MRKLLILAAVMATAPACVDFDLTGLESLDDYAVELAASFEPDFIQCTPSPSILVGEQTACHAYNAASTHIVYSSVAPLIWESSEPGVATISADGVVVGGSPGTTTIIARGPNGSEATLPVTVS